MIYLLLGGGTKEYVVRSTKRQADQFNRWYFWHSWKTGNSSSTIRGGFFWYCKVKKILFQLNHKAPIRTQKPCSSRATWTVMGEGEYTDEEDTQVQTLYRSPYANRINMVASASNSITYRTRELQAVGPGERPKIIDGIKKVFNRHTCRRAENSVSLFLWNRFCFYSKYTY